jgi:hypothetical protein
MFDVYWADYFNKRMTCSELCRHVLVSRKPKKCVCGATFCLQGKFCSRICGYKHRATKPMAFLGRKVSQMGAPKARHIYGGSCLICGFDRAVDYAHIVPASKGGTIHPSNILPLCPNHHRLFDKGILTMDEMAKISHRLSGQAQIHGD